MGKPIIKKQSRGDKKKKIKEQKRRVKRADKRAGVYLGKNGTRIMVSSLREGRRSHTTARASSPELGQYLWGSGATLLLGNKRAYIFDSSQTNETAAAELQRPVNFVAVYPCLRVRWSVSSAFHVR